MKNIVLITILLFSFFSCNNNVDEPSAKYLRMVGDILPNKNLDDPLFVACNDQTALQYFNFGKGLPYKGEKYAIKKLFFDQYRSENIKKERGLLRIRFLVNCRGETGRFRIHGMDNNYKEKEFDLSISEQLLSITKNMDGWMPLTNKGQERDYYQYLIFKIEYGKLIEIMP